MKKIFALMTICLLILLTGCGGEKKTPADAPGELRLGIIRHLNITETLLDTYLEKATSRMAQTAEIRKPKHIFFDNMTTMVAALQARQIDEISTYKVVANYLLAQTNDFEIATDRVPKVSDSFCCALREENSALKEEFDAAIKKLTDDGTLDKLTKTYIDDADYTKTPTAVEMPVLDSEQTIKIAVTGDLPPLDYVSADGKAAGFNTAVLAEISKLVGKNFVLVHIDSGARAAALTSKQVDVVFWAAVPLNETLSPPDCDKPAGIILTVPYFKNEITHVKLKSAE